MDAARLKPGLDVTVNVKFSPIHEEEVTGEISFLTLSAEYPETFHEFRVSVRCTPQSAVPVLDPTELRFPSAPIWRYNDVNFNERVLTVSNDGRKSFSLVIEERNDRDHSFLWRSDRADIQSLTSSISCFDENENMENNENTLGNQNSRKKYRIEVPPKFKCYLKITFRPRCVGLHHEMLEICFLTDNKTLGQLSVPIWAEVTGYQIYLDPPCVDLGIVMIDSDVCQQSFNIVNNGRSPVNILMKIPKNLKNQASVYPKSTIVQSESCSKINVRLIPKSSIVEVSKRFYEPISNMLEFPIQVQIMSQGSEKPPPLMLKVLATLTTSRGLTLEPGYVELGYVHTHESVYAELTLTNESLLIQEYAFIDLSPSMEIQPNHGFGAILPGETIKLHLIYSPCLTDIPGNEIRANGLSGERSFQVQVVTLAELAGDKRQTILNKLKDEINTRSIIPKSRGFPHPVPVNVKTPKVLRKTIDQNEDDPEMQLNNDTVINRGDENGKKLF
ncbi:hypothetical protein K0M31_006594 [Melipona bicolor]|uniref:Uncharacterized protein n=1 Tax=Melipona bicolor TaxID=60889 RepID=A0AA40FRW1_9HYME|nr:hypothetical protein K0M31_006594 [Melipona bicolor]